MTTLTFPLTNRIRLESNALQRFLCDIGIHDFSRWEIREVTLTQGRKSWVETHQFRECLNCGLSQRKPL